MTTADGDIHYWKCYHWTVHLFLNLSCSLAKWMSRSFDWWLLPSVCRVTNLWLIFILITLWKKNSWSLCFRWFWSVNFFFMLINKVTMSLKSDVWMQLINFEPCKISEFLLMWHHGHKYMYIAEVTLERFHEPYWFFFSV